jgi:hypothetical protein
MSEPERKSLFGMEEVGGWWTASIREVLSVRDVRFEGMAKNLFMTDRFPD